MHNATMEMSLWVAMDRRRRLPRHRRAWWYQSAPDTQESDGRRGCSVFHKAEERTRGRHKQRHVVDCVSTEGPAICTAGEVFVLLGAGGCG